MISRFFSWLGSTIGRIMTYTLLLLFCVYYAYSGIASLFKGVKDVTLRPTQLNILDILETNKLIVSQMGVDYFLNTRDYVAIVPYTVRAGFNLGANLKDITSKESDGTVVVRLPKPEVLSVATSISGENPEVPVRDGKPDKEFTKALRVFGERHAKNVAIKRDILKKANERGVAVLTDMVKALGLSEKIRVETTPPSDILEVTYRTDFLPIMLTLPADYPYSVKVATTVNQVASGEFIVSPRDTGTESIYIEAIDFSQGNTPKDAVGKLFDPLDRDKVFSMRFSNDQRTVCTFQIRDRRYIAVLDEKSKQLRDKRLPDLLTCVYGLHENTSMVEDDKCRDIYGRKYSDYAQMSSDSKRDYFSRYIRSTPDTICVWRDEKYGLSVTSDTNGKGKYESDVNGWITRFDKVIEDTNINVEEIVGIIYDSSDKYLLFLPHQMCIFFDGYFSSDYGHLQYSSFFDRSKINSGKTGVFFQDTDKLKVVAAGNEDLCDSVDLNSLLRQIVSFGIISLHAPGCGYEPQ